MTVVVTLKPGEQGRHYRLPTDADYAAVYLAQERLARILDEWERSGRQGLCPVPDEPTPVGGGSGAGRAFNVQKYGMMQWSDLFTARQKAALVELGRLTAESAIGLSSLALGKTADLSNAGAPWKPDAECPVHMLSSQKIPPFWELG